MKKLIFLALTLLSLNAYALLPAQLSSVLWNPEPTYNSSSYLSCFKDTSAGSHYALGYAYTSNYSETSAGSGVPNANATRRIRNQFLATTDLLTINDPKGGGLVDGSRSVANFILGAVNLNIFYNHAGANRQLTIPVNTYQSSATGGIRTQYGSEAVSIFSTIAPAYGTNVRIYNNTLTLGAGTVDTSYLKVTVKAPNNQDLNFYFDCQVI